LSGETTVDEILRQRRPGALLARHLPAVKTKVTIDNRASGRFTVVDVRAQDRVGLLYVIARALRAEGAQIDVAQVATEAHSAVDSFYVTREGARIEDPDQVVALAEAIEKEIDAFG
jgi:[protein-PII] uridylyltransferase